MVLKQGGGGTHLRTKNGSLGITSTSKEADARLQELGNCLTKRFKSLGFPIVTPMLIPVGDSENKKRLVFQLPSGTNIDKLDGFTVITNGTNRVAAFPATFLSSKLGELSELLNSSNFKITRYRISRDNELDVIIKVSTIEEVNDLMALVKDKHPIRTFNSDAMGCVIHLEIDPSLAKEKKAESSEKEPESNLMIEMKNLVSKMINDPDFLSDEQKQEYIKAWLPPEMGIFKKEGSVLVPGTKDVYMIKLENLI
ncbi:hypothetical protein GW765_01405 [Candidatus Parcubacteria bacterium]|nr:hypothetical protein [Candidatus Parcubacteria bacterium]